MGESDEERSGDDLGLEATLSPRACGMDAFANCATKSHKRVLLERKAMYMVAK